MPFNASKHFEMVFLQDFFGPKKRLCHLQMDEPVADAVPEDNPADEASEGVVISKNISISFNGGKAVTIPSHFIVEDCGS